MSNTLYLECLSGISGDMFVGAMLDLGADEEGLLKALDSIDAHGFEVKISRVKKSGLDGCDFDVLLDHEHENHDHDMEYLHGHSHTHEHDHKHSHHEECHHGHEHHHEHRNLSDCLHIIERCDMTEHAKEIAGRIFQIIAQAEAQAHGETIENVHFHEVGAIDSIADICAAAFCIDNLGIDKVIVPKLYEGHGTIRCQHGIIPVPVPAVVNIVSKHQIILCPTQVEGELVTPTGAAIVAAIQTSTKLPEQFTIQKVGIGTGKRNYERPSLLRAMLIKDTQETEDRIYKLETNIDDCSGEVLGYTMDCLFEAGARDVHYFPVFMKKNRPAYQLNVICDQEQVEVMEKIIFRETTTIGIRRVSMERTVLKRSFCDFSSSLGMVKMKLCEYKGQTFAYPEYEDVKKISSRKQQSYRKTYEMIKREWEEDKKQKLIQLIDEYTKQDVAIAFSGGVDSSLILKIACEQAKKNGTTVYAVTLHTMLHPAGEIETAQKVAKEAGAVHKVLEIDELKDAGVGNNPEDRCYRCKKHLFAEIKKLAESLGVSLIMEGTNEDDLHVYRPGIKAVKELGIKSPLAECGFAKKDIRALAADYHISVSNKPSMPCLATRFPYGTEISYEKLKVVDKAEIYLRNLGLYNVRVRVHGDIARIEVDQDAMQKILEQKDAVVSYLKNLGYTYITLDLEGFRSGSMDIHIKEREGGI